MMQLTNKKNHFTIVDAYNAIYNSAIKPGQCIVSVVPLLLSEVVLYSQYQRQAIAKLLKQKFHYTHSREYLPSY